MKHLKYYVFGLVLLMVVVLAIYGINNVKTITNNKVNIVSAENFWGSLASQIGGNRVNNFSVINDPNVDPHEYEASSLDAVKISQANLVIINGAGYDQWASQMTAASNNPHTSVLNVASLIKAPSGANPHFWYNPSYVNTVDTQIANELIRIDPSHRTYYLNNLKLLNQKLAVYQDKIKYIQKHFSNVKVAATEDIFQYLASSANLNLISPPSFIQAVAEGNDPPAPSVVVFQNQLQSHQPKILVYNIQTVTPLTETMKAIAQKQGIPVVGISETIHPINLNFEDWMNQQVTNIIKALNSNG